MRRRFRNRQVRAGDPHVGFLRNFPVREHDPGLRRTSLATFEEYRQSRLIYDLSSITLSTHEMLYDWPQTDLI